MTVRAKTESFRQVLSTQEETRAAVVEIAGLADRSLAILTQDLEPDIYDHDDFLEVLKRFILARSFARVRVLIVDPNRTIKNGNRFVAMGRRLNSYIEFRHVKSEYREGHPEAFCVADEAAIVYRANAGRWEGMSDTYAPAIADRYLQMFDELWQACELESELRQLHV